MAGKRKRPPHRGHRHFFPRACCGIGNTDLQCGQAHLSMDDSPSRTPQAYSAAGSSVYKIFKKNEPALPDAVGAPDLGDLAL
jgi:hypothetical protein